MAHERLIRKYSNRRLYDTEASRHVTLSDLRGLITAGHKIKVVDDKSGEDLTRAVLLQIIAEQEQFGAPVLSVELLEIIIRFYASPMQSMLTRYLEQGFGTMLRQQEAMRGEMNKALNATPLAAFVDLARTNMEAFARMQTSLFRTPGAPAPPAPSSEASTEEPSGSGDSPQPTEEEEKK